MSPETFSYELDFLKDWAELMRRRLLASRYEVPETETPDQVCIKYFNVLRRCISVKPRMVHVSREFRCPSVHQHGIDSIRAKVSSGQNLNPHLSRNLLDLDYNDLLLNDWRIHHFHLSTILDPSGFVTRTDPLLFAMVTDTDFYMIDVMHHDDWANERLIEIVHNNWPDVIRRYRFDASSL